jgi:hypothetical protein
MMPAARTSNIVVCCISAPPNSQGDDKDDRALDERKMLSPLKSLGGVQPSRWQSRHS